MIIYDLFITALLIVTVLAAGVLFRVWHDSDI
jgi:hypothetical protein